MVQFVWFITGTSTGFGRELSLAALKRGDKVIATARNLAKINDLQDCGADILELDVTWSSERLDEVVNQAVVIHGRVDVLVNNAGYSAFGILEEKTSEETFHQFNTNVFGPLNIARAVLPHMRTRKSGTVVWIGSLGGWWAAPYAGLYASTKFAIRGLAESMNAEISPLGLRCLYFEPGYFKTSILNPKNLPPYECRIPDYAEMTASSHTMLKSYDKQQPGDPKKGAEIMVDVIRGEGVAKGRDIPTGLPLGSDCFAGIKNTLSRTEKVLSDWADVINSTNFSEGH